MHSLHSAVLYSCKFRCVSVVEFYAPRYGTVDADPSLPEQKLSLDWVYPLIPPQCKHLIRYITCMYYVLRDDKLLRLL